MTSIATNGARAVSIIVIIIAVVVVGTGAAFIIAVGFYGRGRKQRCNACFLASDFMHRILLDRDPGRIFIFELNLGEVRLQLLNQEGI